MKFLKKLLVFLVVLILLLVVIAFFLPKKIHVERTATTKASPEAVFACLNNLKTYDEWMPWNKIDPNMKKTYGDKTDGEGAWYSWVSDVKNVGQGKLTISESKPYTSVKTELEFTGQGNSLAGWTITPTGTGSSITWWIDTDMGNNPVARWLGLFMDKMIGPDFDKGLSDLAKVAEANPPAPKEPNIQIEEADTRAYNILYIKDTANSEKEIGPKLAQIYGSELGVFMKKAGLKMMSPPMAWYNGPQAPYIFEAGVAVDKLPAKTEGRVMTRKIPAGKAVVAHFYGPYDLTSKGYKAVGEWLQQHSDKKAGGPPYEIYIGDPGIEKDPYKVQTDIVFPLK